MKKVINKSFINNYVKSRNYDFDTLIDYQEQRLSAIKSDDTAFRNFLLTLSHNVHLSLASVMMLAARTDGTPTAVFSSVELEWNGQRNLTSENVTEYWIDNGNAFAFVDTVKREESELSGLVPPDAEPEGYEYISLDNKSLKELIEKMGFSSKFKNLMNMALDLKENANAELDRSLIADFELSNLESFKANFQTVFSQSAKLIEQQKESEDKYAYSNINTTAAIRSERDSELSQQVSESAGIRESHDSVLSGQSSGNAYSETYDSQSDSESEKADAGIAKQTSGADAVSGTFRENESDDAREVSGRTVLNERHPGNGLPDDALSASERGAEENDHSSSSELGADLRSAVRSQDGRSSVHSDQSKSQSAHGAASDVSADAPSDDDYQGRTGELHAGERSESQGLSGNSDSTVSRAQSQPESNQLSGERDSNERISESGSWQSADRRSGSDNLSDSDLSGTGSGSDRNAQEGIRVGDKQSASSAAERRRGELSSESVQSEVQSALRSGDLSSAKPENSSRETEVLSGDSEEVQGSRADADVSSVREFPETERNFGRSGISESSVRDFRESVIAKTQENIVSARSEQRANYSLSADDTEYDYERFRHNMQALETLAELTESHRVATVEEQALLAGYSGWGGFTISTIEDHKDDFLNKCKITEKEYDSLLTSALTAYYTPTSLIDTIYRKLNDMGLDKLDHIELLEPGCGVGKFIGRIPLNMSSKVHATGIELDTLSARLAKNLYPQSSIVNMSFSDTTARNYFDVAVGNVPFEQIRMRDSNVPEISGQSIHNYFILKTLEELKPGGVCALITSSYTLDSLNEDARIKMSQRGEFLGGVRLNNNAFNRTNTGVITDILFFKKRPQMLSVDQVPDEEWLHSSDIDVSDFGWASSGDEEDRVRINDYFYNHQEQIAGTLHPRWDGRFNKWQVDVTGESLNNEATVSKINAALEKIKGEIDPVSLNNNLNQTETVQYSAEDDIERQKAPLYSFFINETGDVCYHAAPQDPITVITKDNPLVKSVFSAN